MKVYIVIYNGLDNEKSVKKITCHEWTAEDYIQTHGGWSSEIHSYEIEEQEVEE